MQIINDRATKIEVLRDRRRRECFPIINRGKAWYDLLTIEQEAELKDWYAQWLKVTETLVAPIRPSWLNDKLDTEVQYL